MVKYGVDIENVVWNGRKYSLLSWYLAWCLDRSRFMEENDNSYSLKFRELLLLGCRVSDQVVRIVQGIHDHRVLVTIAHYLNVPGDIDVLPYELLEWKILRAMKIMSSSPTGGSLKNLSLGVIAWNVCHHREPYKAIDHLPLPVTLNKMLKQFIDPSPDCKDNS